MADTKWMVGIDLGDDGIQHTAFVCGVFDTRDEAKAYVTDRSFISARSPREYQIVEVPYKPKPEGD